MALTQTGQTLDLAPRKVDLCFTRADTMLFGFILQDSATPPAAIDITGRTYLFTVSDNENPPDATGQQFQIVGVVPAGTDGLVTFTPAAGDLAGLTPGTDYYFDVQQTDGSQIRTVIKGKITIIQDITK